MKELFKKLGATEKEMNIYLKLLEIGPQPISVIAKYAQIPRSSMYVVIEKMKKLHLIENFIRAQIQYVRAVSTEELKNIILIAEQNIKTTTSLLEHYLPALVSIEHTSPLKPFVRHYEGKEEVMKLYAHIFEEKAYVGFFDPKLVVETLGKEYLEIAKLSTLHNSEIKEIATYSEEAFFFKEKYSSSHHHIKILPPHIHLESDTIITDTTIYMIAFKGHDASGVEIHSPILAHSMRLAFEGWWNQVGD